jgi:hypothetical protein
MDQQDARKKLTFTNKRVTDAIKSVTIPGYIATREVFSKVPDEMTSNNAQLRCLNRLYLGHDDDQVHTALLIGKEVRNKLEGYARQDKQKGMFDKKTLIDYEDCLAKLVASKLKCHYCKKSIFVIYQKVRQDDQWTLDRLNNDLCHSAINTVISCLRCNLTRRCQDADKFYASKTMRICKQGLSNEV